MTPLTPTNTTPLRACERGGLAQARTPARRRTGSPMKNRTATEPQRIASEGLVRGLTGMGGPPTGNTGGKSSPQIQWDRRTLLLHWLRVTHPIADRQRLRSHLVKLFGLPDECKGGRYFYDNRERFSNGIEIWWGMRTSQTDDTDDDSRDRVCVDVPGSALEALDFDQLTDLACFLVLGGRVTRMDLAADAYHSERVGLVDAALESCMNNELCQAKRWKPHLDFEGNKPAARGVCIGLRGNLGSGRYVRVYDKGLETESLPAGQWERYEVEFADECATEAAIDIFDGRRDWEWRAWARINGAISFREDTAGACGNISRRPFTPWWQRWLDGSIPESTVPQRIPTRLFRHATWLIKAALPTVATLAQQTGISITEAINKLCGDNIAPKQDPRSIRVMIAEWRALLGEDGTFEHTDHRPCIC